MAIKEGMTDLALGTRVAPLGLRFWDVVTGAFVGDGLRVRARLATAPRLRAEAVVNGSSVWVFHHLPGLGSFERAQRERSLDEGAPANEPVEAGDALWNDPELAKKREYVIEVEDEARRFLPVELRIQAPHRWIHEWTPPAVMPGGLPGSGLPKGPGGAIPLLSAATRRVPVGMGAIRADLWDPEATVPGKAEKGAPAAWAVVKAKVGNSSWSWGVADGEGRLLVVFPWPAPVAEGLNGAKPMAERSWKVELAAWYERGKGGGERLRLPEALGQQAATLWGKWAELPAERVKLGAGALELGYGEELVVTTTGASASKLYSTAALP